MTGRIIMAMSCVFSAGFTSLATTGPDYGSVLLLGAGIGLAVEEIVIRRERRRQARLGE